jgi:hypothetical protein
MAGNYADKQTPPWRFQWEGKAVRVAVCLADMITC